MDEPDAADPAAAAPASAQPLIKASGLGLDGEHGPLYADIDLALDPGFLAPALNIGAVAWYGQFLKELVAGIDRIAEAHGAMVLGGTGASMENLLILELANGAHVTLLARDARGYAALAPCLPGPASQTPAGNLPWLLRSYPR